VIAHINGPDARTRAEVEDAVWIWRNWGEVESAVEGEEEEVVVYVHLVGGRFIVGSPAYDPKVSLCGRRGVGVLGRRELRERWCYQ
jgi:hypothetical protein